jgi:hypothetical protein
MKCRVDMDSWPDLSIIANFDEIAVQEHAPVIDEPVAVEADVPAVVAAEGRLELSAATDATQQDFQQRWVSSFGIVFNRAQVYLRFCQSGLKLRIS